MKTWWKVLSVVLLLYVIIVGLVVPLKPGIESVSPGKIGAGELLVLEVKGYNTDFLRSSGEQRAWLKLNDSMGIAANQLLPRSEREMRISFSLPADCPITGVRHPLSLVIDDAYHGSIVLPSAVYVTDIQHNPTSKAWSGAPIKDLNRIGRMVYPYRSILYETIRNVYFHVPMWFGMIILFFASAGYAVKYIRTGSVEADRRSLALVTTGTVFGVLGILTGMLWSTYTWGEPWSFDVKQNTAAIALLIYFAYFILRQSFDDDQRKARIGAVYNVFGAAMLIPLLFIIPRMTDSLHPGSGGNPALGGEDLDNTMRLVFYPAVIGWTILGFWMSDVLNRVFRLRNKLSF